MADVALKLSTDIVALRGRQPRSVVSRLASGNIGITVPTGTVTIVGHKIRGFAIRPVFVDFNIAIPHEPQILASHVPRATMEVVSQRQINTKVYDVGNNTKKGYVTGIEHVPSDYTTWKAGGQVTYTDINLDWEQVSPLTFRPKSGWFSVTFAETGFAATFTWLDGTTEVWKIDHLNGTNWSLSGKSGISISGRRLTISNIVDDLDIAIDTVHGLRATGEFDKDDVEINKPQTGFEIFKIVKSDKAPIDIDWDIEYDAVEDLPHIRQTISKGVDNLDRELIIHHVVEDEQLRKGDTKKGRQRREKVIGPKLHLNWNTQKCEPQPEELVYPLIIDDESVVTSGTSLAKPSDWNDSDNSIEVVGGGAGGEGGETGVPDGGGGGGGGGGAYGRADNHTWTTDPETIQIGSGGTAGTASYGNGGNGGQTWYDGTGVLTSGTASGGGQAGNGLGGGGGNASGSALDAEAFGGSAGHGGSPAGDDGGGGGGGGAGAGGDVGNGNNGTTGGNGSGSSAGAGGDGGDGNSTDPNSGEGASGGAGNGAAGGNGTDLGEGTAGTGGGGAGGAGGEQADETGHVGGAGGNYGAGGGGGGGSGDGMSGGNGAAGGPGVIILTWTPAGANHDITPPAGSESLTGAAPTSDETFVREPGKDDLAISGQAPTLLRTLMRQAKFRGRADFGVGI